MATNYSKDKRCASVFKNERKKNLKNIATQFVKKNFHLERYFYTIAGLVMNAFYTIWITKHVNIMNPDRLAVQPNIFLLTHYEQLLTLCVLKIRLFTSKYKCNIVCIPSCLAWPAKQLNKNNVKFIIFNSLEIYKYLKKKISIS